MKNLISKLLIYFGVLCLSATAFVYWQRTTPKRLAFDIKNNALQGNIVEAAILPERLVIKDLNIDLHIYPAEIKNSRWQATTNGVSYLTSSPIPGETGNSILYGHNWTSLLGRLVNAKPGENIEIIFSDGSSKKFVVEYTQLVTPDQTDILENTEDRRITLYTCTGFLDGKRFVVTATFKDII